jgi:hypothetical protein
MARPATHPIKKVVGFSPDLWERVRNFRFDQRISSENEAIRQLIEAGLKAGDKIPVRRTSPAGGSAAPDSGKSSTPQPRTSPKREAASARPLSKEAQIRALREQRAR